MEAAGISISAGQTMAIGQLLPVSECSKVRVMAFLGPGSTVGASIAILPLESSYNVGTLDSIRLTPGGRTENRVYDIPGTNWQLQATADVGTGSCVLTMTVWCG